MAAEKKSARAVSAWKRARENNPVGSTYRAVGRTERGCSRRQVGWHDTQRLGDYLSEKALVVAEVFFRVSDFLSAERSESVVLRRVWRDHFGVIVKLASCRSSFKSKNVTYLTGAP